MTALGTGLGYVATSAVVAHTAPALTSIPLLRNIVCPALAGHGAPHHVALTFDDGPHHLSTPRFLRLLEQHDTRATFFVLGHQLRRDPGLGREIVRRGHEIALHGWAHRCLAWRAPRALHRDLAAAKQLITDITGVTPHWYRPPYGVLTLDGLLAARRLNLTPVLWTCWGRDWTRRATPASVATTVRRSLAGGGTMLLHDADAHCAPGSWRATLGAVPDLLDHCRRQGWQVGPLREHHVTPTDTAVGHRTGIIR